MTDALRIGILGTGHMARTMAHAIGITPGIALAGFASRDPVRAAATADAMGGHGFPDLDSLISGCHALYIANENAAHAAAAVTALAARRPVLCEKPCALDAAQARRIAEAAKESGTLFMEAMATPLLPAVRRVLETVASGKLGEPAQLSASFGYPTSAESHPGLHVWPGGGVLLDRAVYLVWLARLTFGPVAEVKAKIGWRGDLDVDAAIILRHHKGAISTLTASITAELDNRLLVAGSAGSAMIEAPLLAAERLRIRRHGPAARPEPSAGAKARLKALPLIRALRASAGAVAAERLSYGGSPYGHELAHFRDLVRAGATESPILPPSLSVEVMEIIDHVRGAAR